MVRDSRRRVLRATGALLTAGVVAGCGERTHRNPPPSTRSLTPVDGYETHVLRTDDPTPVLASASEDEERHPRNVFVATESQRDALRYERSPDGVDALRSFVANTALSTHSVFIVQGEVGECHRRRLDAVRRGDGEFDVEFCRVYRDADVACQTDERDLQVTAIRFPFTYDGFPPDGYSVGGGHSCTGPGGEEA